MHIPRLYYPTIPDSDKHKHDRCNETTPLDKVYGDETALCNRVSATSSLHRDLCHSVCLSLCHRMSYNRRNEVRRRRWSWRADARHFNSFRHSRRETSKTVRQITDLTSHEQEARRMKTSKYMMHLHSTFHLYGQMPQRNNTASDSLLTVVDMRSRQVPSLNYLLLSHLQLTIEKRARIALHSVREMCNTNPLAFKVLSSCCFCSYIIG